MPRCVIADSEDTRRRRLATTLTRLGFEVLEARSGADIRTFARQHPLDLVLVQSWLKDGTGAGAIEGLRAARPDWHAHVILLSHTASERLVYEALEAGADDYLADAFDTDQLLFKLDLAAEQGRLAGWVSAVEADRQRAAVGMAPQPVT